MVWRWPFFEVFPVARETLMIMEEKGLRRKVVFTFGIATGLDSSFG